MNIKDILLNSKLCFGPMSKNIVDSIIKFSNENHTPITFIPSRRQIEWNGGYVNNWTTENFSNYVKSKSKYIAIQRDHGGPGQGLYDDDGFESLKYDCKFFDAIHIDPWLKYKNFQQGLKWTIDILNFCYNENSNLYFEIGTEEAIRKFDIGEIELLLSEIKRSVSEDLFDKILFCVIQSGTSLQNGKNIGIYKKNKLVDMISVVKKFNKLSKEHNGDFMEEETMINRFNNKLDSINIAPELGFEETKIILEDLKNKNMLNEIDLFYNLCLKSGKWKKWVNEDFIPKKNKIKIIEICGHYVFSHPEFYKIKIIKNIEIRDRIEKHINIFFINSNIYFKKYFLRKINRIHPLRDEQKVDNRLRLHRAERLYPFPNDFFNKFINNITQEDIRYYPDVHSLKEKIVKKYKLQNSNIFLNNGSSENIRIFYEAFAVENKEVIITKPCYPMHKIYAEIQNSNIIEVQYNEDKIINYQDIIDKININTCSVVLANPNSPIGDIINLDNLEKIISKSHSINIPILIDEAYIEYAEQESCIKLLSKYPNLVISRTFSKGLGCAGLRIGYLIGNTDIMNVINTLIPTYEISSISARFGEYILENYHIVEDYIKLIKKEKQKVEIICRKNYIPCILNHINTIYIKPKKINNILSFLKENKILHRTRKLPFDNEEWLAIVLYPGFSKSNIINEIIR